jgi:hypothetical protein
LNDYIKDQVAIALTNASTAVASNPTLLIPTEEPSSNQTSPVISSDNQNSGNAENQTSRKRKRNAGEEDLVERNTLKNLKTSMNA